MRDLELTPAPSAPADPAVDDAAYAAASPGGVLSDTALTDPAFSDLKAYGKPSLGGEFAPGRAGILSSGFTDGGEAAFGEAYSIIVTPPVVPTPPNAMPLGRSANATTRLNLYPWFKVPPQGLDMNNPYVPPVVEDPPLADEPAKLEFNLNGVDVKPAPKPKRK